MIINVESSYCRTRRGLIQVIMRHFG